MLWRKQRKPHQTKVVELPDEVMCWSLKYEYDRVSFTLAGLTHTTPPSLWELPGRDEATVRVVPRGNRLIQMGRHCMIIHAISRDAALDEDPCHLARCGIHPTVGRQWSGLVGINRYSQYFKSYLYDRTLGITDDWRNVSYDDESSPWMGTTTFLTSTSVGSGDSSDVPVRVADRAVVGEITSSRPWDGDLHQRSIYADSSFIRRDDGV